MKIDIRNLNAKKQYSGEFSFDYSPSKELCIVPLCEIEGDVKVRGSYEIYEDNAVGVLFTIEYLLVGQCSYCLTATKKQITFESDILYVCKQDNDDYYYDGNKIDLTTAVNDAILTSQPNVILCGDDCSGIDITNK